MKSGWSRITPAINGSLFALSFPRKAAALAKRESRRPAVRGAQASTTRPLSVQKRKNIIRLFTVRKGRLFPAHFGEPFVGPDHAPRPGRDMI